MNYKAEERKRKKHTMKLVKSMPRVNTVETEEMKP